MGQRYHRYHTPAPATRHSSPKTRGDGGLQSPKGTAGGARRDHRPPPLSFWPSKPDRPTSHWGPPGVFPPGLSGWGGEPGLPPFPRETMVDTAQTLRLRE